LAVAHDGGEIDEFADRLHLALRARACREISLRCLGMPLRGGSE
jgi:hypothetical protein